MKKICLFITSMVGGGAEKVFMHLANEMLKDGYKINLVLMDAKGPYLDKISPNVTIFDLKTTNYFKSLLRFSRYLVKNKPTVVLSGLLFPNLVTVLSKFLTFTNTKIILSEHSNISASTKNIKLSFKRKFINLFLPKLYNAADGIVAVSKGVADDMAKIYKLKRERIQVIFNPIITDKTVIQSNQKIIDEWFHNNKIPYFIAVGRFTKPKNFPLLIEAFANVRKQTLCELVLLGEGEDRQLMEQLIAKYDISKDVYMPGFVDNPYNWMKNAKAFVLSSSWEGFGNVIVEAMAAGTHVISTDCPSGPSEILENGRYGTLVPVKNVDALSNAMLDILKSNKPIPEYSKVLYQYETNYIARKYLEYFKYLVG